MGSNLNQSSFVNPVNSASSSPGNRFYWQKPVCVKSDHLCIADQIMSGCPMNWPLFLPLCRPLQSVRTHRGGVHPWRRERVPAPGAAPSAAGLHARPVLPALHQGGAGITAAAAAHGLNRTHTCILPRQWFDSEQLNPGLSSGASSALSLF